MLKISSIDSFLADVPQIMIKFKHQHVSLSVRRLLGFKSIHPPALWDLLEDHGVHCGRFGAIGGSVLAAWPELGCAVPEPQLGPRPPGRLWSLKPGPQSCAGSLALVAPGACEHLSSSSSLAGVEIRPSA